MRKSRALRIASLVSSLTLLAFLSTSSRADITNVPANLSPPQKLRVALVLDRGGKNDNSFNSAAYAGAMRAKKELGITMKYVESPDILAFETLNRALAKRNYDLIIAIGFGQSDAQRRVAPQFPKIHFAIIDGRVDGPNVKSILFQEHEGSYLVGAIAAMKSKTHKIGFIGGMDIPLIRRFERGYIAGARSIDSKVQVVNQYIGMTAEAWNNPAKAKEMALSQYHQNADIVFVAAGASGTGVFDAADETHNFAIGVDSNQNWMKPGHILTSMVKKVDVAVYDVIREELNHAFKPGLQIFGLNNNGIDYSVDQYNQNLLDKTDLEKIESIKNDIIAGRIEVPDYYKMKK